MPEEEDAAANKFDLSRFFRTDEQSLSVELALESLRRVAAEEEEEVDAVAAAAARRGCLDEESSTSASAAFRFPILLLTTVGVGAASSGVAAPEGSTDSPSPPMSAFRLFRPNLEG